MKTFLLLLSLASVVSAAPSINIRGLVTKTDESVVLDLVADTASELEFRSFGLKVSYDPDQLEVQSVGRYDGIWFLSPDGGTTRFSYTEPKVTEKGCLEIIGGRFDGVTPSNGVTGEQILLATVIFSKKGDDVSKFELGLARPAPFVNFVGADGTSLDANLGGLGKETTLTMLEPIVDSDKDDLPDSYEMATYGSLKATDGSKDTDGDGDSDKKEWLAGTNPNDSDSKLELSFVMQPDGSKLFQWDGIPGRVYTLMESGNLQNFVSLMGGIPGAANQQVMQEGGSTTRGFYTLNVDHPTGR